MQRDPLGVYTHARREFGDYVQIRVVAGVYCYLLTHPNAVEHILHKEHRNYRKPDRFYKSVGLLVGNGLFTNEGNAWHRQRQLAQPAFHRQYVSLLCPLMVQGAEAFVREQQESVGRPIDMVRGMMKVGMRIASTTLFSTDISGDADSVGKAYRTAFAHISRQMNSMQPRAVLGADAGESLVCPGEAAAGRDGDGIDRQTPGEFRHAQARSAHDADRRPG